MADADNTVSSNQSQTKGEYSPPVFKPFNNFKRKPEYADFDMHNKFGEFAEEVMAICMGALTVLELKEFDILSAESGQDTHLNDYHQSTLDRLTMKALQNVADKAESIIDQLNQTHQQGAAS